MNGYEALRGSAAWVDVSGRGRIRATGEDRARLLHAMSTNEIQKLKPGEGTYVFFLNAQGRVLADALVLAREEDLVIDTEPETRAKLYEHLDKFIIADDVTLEDLTDATVEVAIEGPAAAEVLRRMGAPAPEVEFGHAAWGERWVVRASLAGSAEGFLVVAPPGDRGALIEALSGVTEADAEALRTVRIENGKPRYGEDISERYLTQETGQMQAVSFQKGCYLGQEIVERVRSRAQIHRRLLPLRIEGVEAPAAGVKLQANGKDAAEVTSAVYSPGWGECAALGYVRLDSGPGDVLMLGERVVRVGGPRLDTNSRE